MYEFYCVFSLSLGFSVLFWPLRRGKSGASSSSVNLYVKALCSISQEKTPLYWKYRVVEHWLGQSGGFYVLMVTSHACSVCGKITVLPTAATSFPSVSRFKFYVELVLTLEPIKIVGRIGVQLLRQKFYVKHRPSFCICGFQFDNHNGNISPVV